MEYNILNSKRNIWYFIIAMIGLVLMVWQISIYRRTIIPVRIPLLIILVFGVVAYFVDRRFYFDTYKFDKKPFKRLKFLNATPKFWSHLFAFFQSLLSWGCIACTLFMASNKYLSQSNSKTSMHRINNVGDMSGGIPLVRIDHNGIIKELVFRRDLSRNIQKYDSVQIKTTKGFFGYEIIEEQHLIENKSTMIVKENDKIIEILKRLESGMLDYIVPGETGYSVTDVVACMRLISIFLDEIENTNTREEALEIVRSTVLSLNDLNYKCGEELIETGQREDIAEIIIFAGSLKGYNSEDDDITEEWRDW